MPATASIGRTPRGVDVIKMPAAANADPAKKIRAAPMENSDRDFVSAGETGTAITIARANGFMPFARQTTIRVLIRRIGN